MKTSLLRKETFKKPHSLVVKDCRRARKLYYISTANITKPSIFILQIELDAARWITILVFNFLLAFYFRESVGESGNFVSSFLGTVFNFYVPPPQPYPNASPLWKGPSHFASRLLPKAEYCSLPWAFTWGRVLSLLYLSLRLSTFILYLSLRLSTFILYLSLRLSTPTTLPFIKVEYFYFHEGAVVLGRTDLPWPPITVLGTLPIG